jgi:hypothetical protein
MKTSNRNRSPGNIKTILVLDGDVLVRLPVVEFLRECGYFVVEAASADEAIVILQETDVPVDTVLSVNRNTGVDERLWIRAAGSLSSPRPEDSARRNARAHGPQCG